MSANREMQYLDQEGDGIPDAVRITARRVLASTPRGHVGAVEVVVELLSDIGDDGIAVASAKTEMLEFTPAA